MIDEKKHSRERREEVLFMIEEVLHGNTATPPSKQEIKMTIRAPGAIGIIVIHGKARVVILIKKIKLSKEKG